MHIGTRLREHFECGVERYERGGKFDIAWMEDGEGYLVKQGQLAGTEGRMLVYLGEHLPCVKVYLHDQHLLVMEYIQDGCAPDEAECGRLLAKLHQVHADQYGLEFDTTIGPYQQLNPQEDSWINFFRQHRLLSMAKSCLHEKKIDFGTMYRIESLAEKLEELLEEGQPSLIHGDVWSGNVLCRGDSPVFIDPAIYYAHHEMELAFINMFSTFGDRFYAAYREIHPIAPGFFEERSDIYMLYPILVHVRSFGGMYKAMLDEVLKKFSA